MPHMGFFHNGYFAGKANPVADGADLPTPALPASGEGGNPSPACGGGGEGE
jgi:hypothetical protein